MPREREDAVVSTGDVSCVQSCATQALHTVRAFVCVSAVLWRARGVVVTF
jgi:hypothetical protein